MYFIKFIPKCCHELVSQYVIINAINETQIGENRQVRVLP